MKKKDNRRRFIDTWALENYTVLSEEQAKQYTSESAFQERYADIQKAGLSSQIYCVVEGKFGKNMAVSVNGRLYGKNFWDIQLAKEQTQFLLRKGLMYSLFGHVDRGIEDKDVEEGIVAAIVTHLQVIKQPTTINGKTYEPGDLFGRAIVLDMGGKNAGKSLYTLLSVGSEISISSRGLGEYIIGETYETEDGQRIPIMNPETYELETFDFTRLPGISDAEIHCVRDNKTNESQQLKDDTPNESLTIDDDEDDEFTFESIDASPEVLTRIKESADALIFNINQKENNMKLNGVKVQQVLEESNAKIASLTAKLEDAEQAKADAEARADELQKKLDEKPETIEAGTQPEETPTEVSTVKAEETPSVPANTKEVDTADLGSFTAGLKPAEELKKYQDIAETPEELNNILVKVEETLAKCEDDAAEVERLRAERDNLKADLDDKEKDLQECKTVIESYLKLGSVQELQAMVETAKAIKAESRKSKMKEFVEHYSNKKGITQESVKRIIESSKSIKDAKSVLETLPNRDVTKALYRKTESIGSKSQVTSGFETFAESFINKAEARRTRRYTV